MIGDINNIALYSQDLLNGTTTIVISFDKPTGDIGGYYLYKSYDDITYEEDSFLIDFVHYEPGDTQSNYTTESGSTVYFTYSIPSGASDGRMIYIKMIGISVANDMSNYSDVISTYIAPTKPSNLMIRYDGYDAMLSWDELSTSTGRNSSLVDFSVYRKNITQLSDVTYDDGTLTHSSLEVGKAFWITDRIKRCIWFGEITTEGEFVMSDSNKVTQASDNSEEYSILEDNLQYFIEDTSSSVLVGNSFVNSYIDTTYVSDTRYIYTVVSNGTGSKTSEEVKYFLYTVDFLQAYPYLRSAGNSDNAVLQQTQWKLLKAALIDSNYYDKTAYAIPYFKDQPYNLKGYLGVSNSKLDVFINDIYSFTTSTGNYGEFDLNYSFNKGETLVSFQARDKYNIKFSRQSAPYSIRTINLYSWFYSLGVQYDEVETEAEAIQTDVSISEARYSSFVDMYAPLIELYKQGDESETIFRAIASEVFKAFEYASYERSLELLLDAFKNNLESFDDYYIYYRDDLYNTHRTSYIFASTSTGLTRNDYYYGISSCTNDGAETDIQSLRVDRRWWPNVYTGVNVLMWDYAFDTDFYKIYRGTSLDNMYFLTSTETNFFVDIGGFSPNTSIYPRLYNYTSLEKPENLILYDKYSINNLFMRLKKSTSLVIILYGKSSSTIEDYNIERLLLLFEKFIPPEILYRVIFANDDKVILYPEGEEIDLSEPPLNYAIYDESYYDNNEVYS